VTRKLVRDKMDQVPWTHEEAKSTLRPVDNREEHLELLRRKILEEAVELFQAPTKDGIEWEAADLMEVVTCYVMLSGAELNKVNENLRKKVAERGSFAVGLVWEY
jgi:predicted house-cleaning noncanonical NTP pyrophosphatase (MazG superfamily)